MNRDDEEAEQNVGEPIEANGAGGITEAETAEERSLPQTLASSELSWNCLIQSDYMFDVSDHLLDILGKTFLMDRSGKQASEALSPSSQLPHVPRSPGLWHHQLCSH